MEIAKSLLLYYEEEYKDVARFNQANWQMSGLTLEMVVKGGIARVYGATCFAMRLGVPYEQISSAYEEIKRKFEKLLDK